VVERRQLGRGGAAVRAGARLTATQLAETLAAPNPSSVGEAIALMAAIDRALPARDGVAAFTKLYLRVTETVAARLDRPAFRNPIYLARLDVSFANLYFDALRAHFGGDGEPFAAASDSSRVRRDATPRAWRPLFEARGRRDVAPIQFALAGMNAHINRDLPVALVSTCDELGVPLRRGGDEHADYLAVNGLLVETEARVKRDFATGLLGVADEAFGAADDAIAMWNVARARDAAWVNAETLWTLRGAGEVRERYLRTLDGLVGLAGRGLLRPGVKETLWRRLTRHARRILR
jgi:hypothetical protein